MEPAKVRTSLRKIKQTLMTALPIFLLSAVQAGAAELVNTLEVEDWTIAELQFSADEISGMRGVLLASTVCIAKKRLMDKVSFSFKTDGSNVAKLHMVIPSWKLTSGPANVSFSLGQSEKVFSFKSFQGQDFVSVQIPDKARQEFTEQMRSSNTLSLHSDVASIVLTLADFEQAFTATADCQKRHPVFQPEQPVKASAPQVSAGLDTTGIKHLQSALNALGFAAGPADGIMGSRTQTAIRQFEKSVARAETGKATRALLAEVQKEKSARDK